MFCVQKQVTVPTYTQRERITEEGTYPEKVVMGATLEIALDNINIYIFEELMANFQTRSGFKSHRSKKLKKYQTLETSRK